MEEKEVASHLYPGSMQSTLGRLCVESKQLGPSYAAVVANGRPARCHESRLSSSPCQPGRKQPVNLSSKPCTKEVESNSSTTVKTDPDGQAITEGQQGRDQPESISSKPCTKEVESYRSTHVMADASLLERPRTYAEMVKSPKISTMCPPRSQPCQESIMCHVRSPVSDGTFHPSRYHDVMEERQVSQAKIYKVFN